MAEPVKQVVIRDVNGVVTQPIEVIPRGRPKNLTHMQGISAFKTSLGGSTSRLRRFGEVFMLGDEIGKESGKVTGYRILRSETGPKVEVAFQAAGQI